MCNECNNVWACCYVQAWRQGRTGYPLVDAGMRQLWSSGWLHNRSRVVCASFLVKNLLLPWQWGLKHYWDALLDADLECAALGWQYVSGCLAGPRVPYHHIHLTLLCPLWQCLGASLVYHHSSCKPMCRHAWLADSFAPE